MVHPVQDHWPGHVGERGDPDPVWTGRHIELEGDLGRGPPRNAERADGTKVAPRARERGGVTADDRRLGQPCLREGEAEQPLEVTGGGGLTRELVNVLDVRPPLRGDQLGQPDDRELCADGW